MILNKKLKQIMCVVSVLLTMCSFPVEDNNLFSELESVWQYLLVHSIYQWDDSTWVPRNPYLFSSPEALMEAIPDTLHGTQYTGYDVETQNSSRVASSFLHNAESTVYADTLTDSTALIVITEFAYDKTADEFISVLPYVAEFPFLVIDVRDNYGGYIDQVQLVIEAFLPRGQKYIKAREREFDEVARTAKTVTHFWMAEDRINAALQDKKITVLMDRMSASASEILAAALKEGRDAVLVGDTSYGKGIGQVMVPRRKRPDLKITYIQFSGVEQIGVYHRTGIAPDIYLGNDTYSKNNNAYIAAAKVYEPEITTIRKVVKGISKRRIMQEMIVEKYCNEE